MEEKVPFPISKKHGVVIYCHVCPAYPCKRYEVEAQYDSFITYKNRCLAHSVELHERAILMVQTMQIYAEKQHIILKLRTKNVNTEAQD